MFRAATTCCLVLIASLLSFAADWPQWRGPNRDGISAESIEPWKGELKVLWRQPVGEGHSSPIMARDRVFIHAKVRDKEQEEVLAFDARTGKKLWRSPYERNKFENAYGNGPRSTPVVDSDRIYTLGVTGILAAWDATSGKEQWKLDVLREFKAPNLFFGVSSSPVVDGDKLLVLVGGPDASVVAFDKSNGKVRWKTGSDAASYASPIVTSRDGRRLAVFLTAKGVLAVNPADGTPYWQYPLVDKLSESSTTPVRAGDLLFASSVTFGSVGLKLTAKDGKPAYEELWKNDRLTCYFSTPVAMNEHLYIVTGQLLPPSAKLHCIEAKTGNIVWTRPKAVGKYHGTLLLAKDRLLLLEEEGDLVLIEPSPKEYKELSRGKVCGQTWAHPALAHGRLYVRDEKELICVQVGQSP